MAEAYLTVNPTKQIYNDLSGIDLRGGVTQGCVPF